jgi:hypothetical protein
VCCAGALFGWLLLAGPAAAAPPTNDNFASATTESGSSFSASGTNVQAMKQTGEPDHAGDKGGASVWYVWTAPNSGTYQLNTCGSDFDTLLAVYTGSAVNALTEVASNDQSASCFDQSVLYFQAVSATTYHFAVDGYRGGEASAATGSVGVILQQITSPPANDNFASSQVLPSQTENVVQGTDVLATKQSGEPNHAGDSGGASVWYSWVAPVSGAMRMNACASDFFSLISVYTGSAVNALTVVASPPGDCEVTFNAVQGTTYRIAVDSFSDNGGQPVGIGDFRLQTHKLVPPPNDNFANAQTISGSSAHVTGSNIDASIEAGEPAHFSGVGPYASVWYSWTAPTTGQVTLDTCASNFDTILAVYTGSSVNALAPIAKSDDACGAGSRVSFGASQGTTYRIAVDGFFDNGAIDLRLSQQIAQVAPAGDSTPPQSKIQKVIVDSQHGKATVKFGSSEPGSRFKCKLDHGPFKACHSPKTYRHLDAGKHKVKIEALDAAGNLDTSPAVKSFKIKP